MKIRAAVLEEFGAPLAVQELDLAEPGPGEVLVRLEACGVCHTDLYTASGAEGDHVVSLFSPQCGECLHCLSPKTNLCLAIREQQARATCPTAPRGYRGEASRSGTSWAARRSGSTR